MDIDKPVRYCRECGKALPVNSWWLYCHECYVRLNKSPVLTDRAGHRYERVGKRWVRRS